jgi:hypothetical protein
MPLEVNDVPHAMFAGHDMYRTPRVDQHGLILPRDGMFPTTPVFGIFGILSSSPPGEEGSFW